MGDCQQSRRCPSFLHQFRSRHTARRDHITAGLIVSSLRVLSTNQYIHFCQTHSFQLILPCCEKFPKPKEYIYQLNFNQSSFLKPLFCHFDISVVRCEIAIYIFISVLWASILHWNPSEAENGVAEGKATNTLSAGLVLISTNYIWIRWKYIFEPFFCLPSFIGMVESQSIFQSTYLLWDWKLPW